MMRSVLLDSEDPPTEREAFLIREFVGLLENTGLLLDPSDLVLVVAARTAWPEYQDLSTYICQENRSFQPAARIAFYSSAMIQSIVPAILASIDSLTFDESGVKNILDSETRSLAETLLAKLNQRRQDRLGETNKVLFLTEPSDRDTIVLARPVTNIGLPFTYGHRYVSLKRLLLGPETTAELVT